MARDLAITVSVNAGNAQAALSGVERSIQGVSSAASDADGTLNRVMGRLDDMAPAMRRVGGILTAGVTVPIVGIGAAAIKTAMEVVESENLFQVSFGAMAESARDWSVKTSQALGLNQFELRRTSATLFTMFDAMGIAKEGASEMSTGMVELAHDMASFFNLQPEVAFEKLRSGIVGQTEPLRQLGILVDEQTIKQTALRHGLIAQGEEMTQQQKVQARYIAIMEQTTAAQGDLARTADSPTNQLRRMREQMTEVAAELGIALLPAFTSLIGIVQSLIPHVQSAVNWFTNLSPTMQTVIVALAGLAAGLGPVLVAFGAVIPAVTAIVAVLGGPLTLAIAGIVTAIAGLTAAWAVWGNDVTQIVSDTVNGIKRWLVDTFAGIVDSVRQKIDAVKGFFSDLYESVVGGSWVPDLVEGIRLHFERLDTVMVEPSQRGTAAVNDSFVDLSDSLGSLLDRLLGGGGRLTNLLRAFFGSGGLLRNITDGGLQGMWNITQAGLNAVANAFQGVLGGGGRVVSIVRDGFAIVRGIFTGDFASILSGAVSLFSSFASAIKSLIDKLWGWFKGFFKSVWGGLKKIFGFRSSPDFSGIDPGTTGPGDPFGPGFPGETPIGGRHTGGMITHDMPPAAVIPFPITRAHNGLAVGEVPIIALEGEGVLNRAAMAQLGRSGLDSLNSGRGAGIAVGPVHITVSDSDDDEAMADKVAAALVRKMRRSGVRFKAA